MERFGARRTDTVLAYAATWLVVALVVALSVAQAMFNAYYYSRHAAVAFIPPCLVSAGLWLWNHHHVATHRAPRTRLVLTALMVALAVWMSIGPTWLMPPLAMSALILLRSRWRWAALVALTVVYAVLNARDNTPQAAVTSVLTSLVLTGVLVVFTRMVHVVQELTVAQEQVARLRVDEERHRIQRELHDLLGRTLVTVSMRTQTALRLVDKDPAAARAQLDETAALVSSGQAQLRELVAGRSIVGLDQELTAARQLCDRVGIRLECRVEAMDDPSTDDLAARVLREAMTNMLKHSRPTR